MIFAANPRSGFFSAPFFKGKARASASQLQAHSNYEMKSVVLATTLEVIDSYQKPQAEGVKWLTQSRNAPSGFRLAEAKQALRCFAQAQALAPQEIEPHAGLFAAWREMHADALGPRSFAFAKKQTFARCEQSAAEMLIELGYLIEGGSLSQIVAATEYRTDLFVGLGTDLGPRALEHHFLPALEKRLIQSEGSPNAALLVLRSSELLFELTRSQPWVLPKVVPLIERLIDQTGALGLGGLELTRLLVGLGEARLVALAAWACLAAKLAKTFAGDAAIILPLLPLIKKRLQENRQEEAIHTLFLDLVVALGEQACGQAQAFACSRILVEHLVSIAAQKEELSADAIDAPDTLTKPVERLIRGLTSVCRQAELLDAQTYGLIFRFVTEGLTEAARAAYHPQVALAVYTARNALERARSAL